MYTVTMTSKLLKKKPKKHERCALKGKAPWREDVRMDTAYTVTMKSKLSKKKEKKARDMHKDERLHGEGKATPLPPCRPIACC